MKRLFIINGIVVNEGIQQQADILIEGDYIVGIGKDLVIATTDELQTIDATGCHIFPGVIDDQVHFREPGLTHKGDLNSESRAAVAGGVTSYMEMPNSNPQTITLERLEEKFALAGNLPAFKNISSHSL